MTLSTLHRVILPKCYTQNRVFCETIKLLRKYYITTIIIYNTVSISSVFYLLRYFNTKQHQKYYIAYIYRNQHRLFRKNMHNTYYTDSTYLPTYLFIIIVNSKIFVQINRRSWKEGWWFRHCVVIL